MNRESDTLLESQATRPPSDQLRPGGSRSAELALVGLFLALIAGVPLAQAGLELWRGDSIKAFDLFRQRPTATRLRAYEKNLENASAPANLVRPWMQLVQFHWLQDGGTKALIGRDGWLFYRPGLDAMLADTRLSAPTISTHLAEERGGPSPASNDPLPAIVAFRDDLAARGIHLLILIAPNKESIYPDQVTKRAAHLSPAPSRAAQDLLDRLKSAQVETVDLFELFAAARRAGGGEAPARLYLRQDSHWSPHGVRLAAQAVAQRVRSLGWIQDGPAAYRLEPLPIRRTGDVLRMLQSPRLERIVPRDEVPCEQVRSRDSGEPYRDDPNSGLLVLGDSFLRIYEQDEPGAAGFIAHLGHELRQPLTSLVSDGGASTLVRQELHRRPALLTGKKVVVWEFVERDIRLGAEGWQIIPMFAKLGHAASAREY